jgi:hypothetical protein
MIADMAVAYVLAVALGVLPGPADPRLTLTVAWDANPASDNVTGYRVHYGTAPGTYTQHVDVGNAVSTNFTLADGPTYYFVVTAYSATAESGPSAEVSTIPGTPGNPSEPKPAGKPQVIKAPTGVEVQR